MNQTFETTLSKNQALMEAYAKMKSGKTITERHEQLNEAKLSDSQMKKREEIVTGMKKNSDDLQKRYGKDWESVMYAVATKQAISESFDKDGGDSLIMPSDVKHSIFVSDNIHAHSFEPEDKEKVHKHLVSMGFKPGITDVYGVANETKFTHPSGMTAYLGNNRVTGWLDVEKK